MSMTLTIATDISRSGYYVLMRAAKTKHVSFLRGGKNDTCVVFDIRPSPRAACTKAVATQARQMSDKYNARVVFAAHDQEQITAPSVFLYRSRGSRREIDGERRKGRRRPPRCVGMHDLGGHWSAVDNGRRRAKVVAARDLRGKGTGCEWIHLPADLRQPHWLQTSAKPESARYAGRSHRQSGCFAAEARLHDPHRRHYSPVEARGIRQCRSGHRQGESPSACRRSLGQKPPRLR